MAKTDLGDKQACPSCGAKFYDLRKRPALCPKCGATFDPTEESVRVRRRGRVSANDPGYEDDEDEAAAAKKKVPAGDDDEEAEEETAEVDAEAEADPIITSDEDEETEAAGDELPEGFSEEEADLEGDAADDNSVPMIEDDEEFNEDELGVPSADEEER